MDILLYRTKHLHDFWLQDRRCLGNFFLPYMHTKTCIAFKVYIEQFIVTRLFLITTKYSQLVNKDYIYIREGEGGS